MIIYTISLGRDIIAVAKTGSGKTLAFLLPMFRHILDQPRLREGEGPIGLIMAPGKINFLLLLLLLLLLLVPNIQ